MSCLFVRSPKTMTDSEGSASVEYVWDERRLGKTFGAGYNVLPIFKDRLTAKTVHELYFR
ncbi:MAG: hypothetical protein WA869_06695 [Alloacidobacterium sp.]